MQCIRFCDSFFVDSLSYLEVVDERHASLEGLGLRGQEASLFVVNDCRLKVAHLKVGLCLAHVQFRLEFKVFSCQSQPHIKYHD